MIKYLKPKVHEDYTPNKGINTLFFNFHVNKLLIMGGGGGNFYL